MWEKSRAAYHQMAKSPGNLTCHSIWRCILSRLLLIKNGDLKEIPHLITPMQFIRLLPLEENFHKCRIQLGKRQAKLKFDPNHANEAGCYLAGLVWYSHLFREIQPD